MAPHPEMSPNERSLSPMAVRDMHLAKSLIKRADEMYKNLASAGARPATSLKGPGFQVLFALIAVGMTLMALWFFFWAKNGGFKWRGKDDWEDYKSTVMRRKGPDGKTLSNATKSTRLGGGSVVHGGSYGAESSVGYTDETGTSADINEYRDAEEGNGGIRGGDGKKHKKNRRDHTNDYKDPELRNYRHEKAARVGGLNRAADGEYTDYSGSQPASELGSNVSSRPLVQKEPKDPKKEAKEKERRARERMRKAKAAEKDAAKNAAAEAKARKDAEKAEAKKAKEEQKKTKRTRSEAPEMAEVSRPLTEYTASEYTAPSEAPRPAVAGPAGPRRAPPSAAYSFTNGDDTSTVYTGTNTVSSEHNESSYYSDYRPNADPTAYKSQANDKTRSRSSRPSQDRQSRQSQPRTRPSGSRPASQSPRKQQRSSRAPPSDIFTAANGDSRGHMSYPCHIPGLSQASSVGVNDSVSQAGAPTNAKRGRDVMDGYRRGGVRTVGRRDSLSDSDRD
ncbi:uncharacterized protein K460DRAFT_371348 [Cucurbitaria berberidis CBS 394.84]|uniref:Uncharacterized protein n=1 Tax=Cucurbitaria berberidis CBS 394.84 TaxID=1168544 RepID=A0A9P4G7H7_9PLEO|nr:uncharacterized protein K460DRAFT_371348 [Cucurbitaria berberidis CBS 394.84]KAF1840130.1 hypothetical protein K460DRAFT_371348 [Cucurbitaria berberidis CBS 394.84]